MAGLRKRTAELLEAHRNLHGWGHLIDIFLITLITANVGMIMLETIPHLADQYAQAFRYFELFSVAIFTVEYLLRLWSCVETPIPGQGGKKSGRLRWAFTPLGLIDLIAIMPFYISLFIPDGGTSLLMLRVFRALRLLRIFKLTRYSSALTILLSVLKRESRVLAVMSVILLAILLLASWGIYLLERDLQPDVFGSIPSAMWWAVITLTTVGYGDVIPITQGGRVFAGLISLVGIGMMALPAGVLASGFSSEVHRRNRTYSRAAVMAYSDGSLTRHESRELETLREELGLSEEEAVSVNLDAQHKGLQLKECPHCGKEL